MSACCCLALSAAAQSISFSAPSPALSVLPATADYATDVLGNPWDMDSEHDLSDFVTQDNGVGLANYRFENGIFEFDILQGDSAYFHLLAPGQCSANPSGKVGRLKPIDSTKYRYLMIRMYSETSDDLFVLWLSGCDGGDKYRRTTSIPVMPGWHTYAIDMDSVEYGISVGESRSWSQAGRITGLRIDPGGYGATHAKPLHRRIDWIRLTDGPAGAAVVTLPYEVPQTASGLDYSLFLDDDADPFNGVSLWLKQGEYAPALNGTVQVSAHTLAPGSYLLGGYLSDDWATSKIGDPWDFDKALDIKYTEWLDYSLQNGSITAATTASGNRIIFNDYGRSVPGSEYRYICFEATVSHGGEDARIVSSAGGPRFATVQGRSTYRLNMSNYWISKEVINIGVSFAARAGVSFELHWAALGKYDCRSTDAGPALFYAEDAFRVNQPPKLTILQPDARGGADYFSTVLGNPLNMNGLEDVVSYLNIAQADIYPNNHLFGRQGDFLCVTTENRNDDPYVAYFEAAPKGSDRIPADIYRNVTAVFYTNRAQDDMSGHTLRIIAANFARDGKSRYMSGDDTFYHGLEWVTLSQDMTAWTLEEVLHPNPPQPPWGGLLDYLRVDIMEPIESSVYCVDRVEVRADDSSNTNFNITYALTDADSPPADLAVSFFYTTDKDDTAQGKLIPGAQNLKADRNSVMVDFDTAGLPDGAYYVYGVATDGANAHTAKAGGRLQINHTLPQDSAAPDLAWRQPEDGRVVYADSGVTLSGWAQDDIQLAMVEVLLDGDYLGGFVPDRFDKEARAAHSTWADSSNAGFFENLSLQGAARGYHTLRLRACDTAGNCKEQERGVIIDDGSDPNPPQPPAPENETAIPLTGGSAMGLRYNLTANGLLTLHVTNAQNCGAGLVIKSAKRPKLLKRRSSVRTLLQFAAGGGSERTVASLPLARMLSKPGLPPAKKRKKTRLSLGLFCGSASEPASSVSVSFGRIKNAEPPLSKKAYPAYLTGRLYEN